MNENEMSMGFVEMRRAVDTMRSDLNGFMRSARKRRSQEADVVDTLVKSLVVQFYAHARKLDQNAALEILYPLELVPATNRAIVKALADPGRWLARATVSPAQTGIPGWASELAITTSLGAVAGIAPTSVYAALAGRGVRLTFAGNAHVLVPRRTSGSLAPIFCGEGQPLPVKKDTYVGLTANPYKIGVISHFSIDIANYSSPNIEVVIKAGMGDDLTLMIDAALLSNAAGTAISPPGLLNGVTPLPPTPGGGIAALAGDLSQLAAAIPSASDLLYVMNSADRIRALTLAPGLIGVAIVAASTVPAKTVLAMDATDFYSAEDDQPVFDTTSQSLISPTDPGEVVIAGPSTSLWQQQLVGVRLRSHASWGMRQPGRLAATAGITW